MMSVVTFRETLLQDVEVAFMGDKFLENDSCGIPGRSMTGMTRRLSGVHDFHKRLDARSIGRIYIRPYGHGRPQPNVRPFSYAEFIVPQVKSMFPSFATTTYQLTRYFSLPS
jgi:hypothetical protein